jgi:alpha-ketoglutarate-dependent taurine dioxygenase
MSSHYLEPITDHSAWTGEDLKKDRSWVFQLSHAALAEIDAALRQIQKSGIPIHEINSTNFQTPSLNRDLQKAAHEIEHGTGFVLIRGLPVHRYSEEEVALIFCGIGSHFGIPISQNLKGEKLSRVRAEGGKAGQKNVRAYTTDSRLRFHSDDSDIIALCCLRPAKEGGQSSVVSAMTVYNEIRKICPDYLEQLFNGFVYDLMGEERAGIGPVTENRIPVLSYYSGKLSCRYSRNAINLAPQKSGISLTPKEVEILDFFDSIAERPDLRFDLFLEPGDMQFLNNHIVLHSRTEYVDFKEPHLKRDLLRLWLTAENGRPLAQEFENRYGGSYSFRLGVPVRENG